MKRKVIAGLVLAGVLGISGTAFAGISVKPTEKRNVSAPVRRSLTPHEIKRLQEEGKPIPPDLMTPPEPRYPNPRPSAPQRPTEPQYRPKPQRPVDPPRKPDVHRPADQTPARPKRPSDYEQYRPSDSNSQPQRPAGPTHRPDDRRPPFSRDRRLPPPDDKRPSHGTDVYRPPMPERK